MALSSLLQHARQATTAIPRLSKAALSAGLGPAGAAQVVMISGQALRVAAGQAGEPGRQNAVRHFIWQSLLTARFGRDVAASIAEAQEVGTPDLTDSKVDRHNNAVGQAYGEEHANEYGDLPIADALARLTEVALTKWAADELIWVKKH